MTQKVLRRLRKNMYRVRVQLSTCFGDFYEGPFELEPSSVQS